MTREELAERVNELLIERATSETKTALHEKAMSLIDLYAESREIPPPPLKWSFIHKATAENDSYFPFEGTDEDGDDDFVEYACVYIFGHYFSIDRMCTGMWYVTFTVIDQADGPEHDLSSEQFKTKEEAFAFCEKRWAGIWEKEMSH